MRFTCRDIHDHASELADAVADPASAAAPPPERSASEWDELRKHMALCPPCLEYVRQIGLTIEALRALPGEKGTSTRAALFDRFEAWAARRRSGES